MSRIPLLDPATAEPAARALLDDTQRQLGRTPNLYRAMANSPAALAGYLAFRGALQSGHLTPLMREQLALLTAQENGCEYCISAHAFRGGKLGLAAEEIAANRAAQSQNAKTASALTFARRLLASAGRVTDTELAAVHAAGWSDAELGEIVAHLALNAFSNIFNHLATPELDFPRVEAALR